MAIQLTSNCCLVSNGAPADPHLGSLISFSERSSTQEAIDAVVVRQLSPETAIEGRAALPAAAKTLLQLAPRNPAVVLSVNDRDKPLQLQRLVVISSARTIEIYRGNGDYMGTFQGEPWSKSSTSAPSPQSTAADMTVASITGGDSRLMATAPLFRIQIDLAMLTIGPTQGVMIKFFIPKRPIAHQDKLTIQEIDIIENMLSVGHQQPLPQQKSQQEQNQSTQETTTPESSSNPLQSMSATESSHSGGIESLLLLGCLGGNSSSGGIDMAKVREMLGDMRIDQLPQGARDLMQTMEQQSQLRQAFVSPQQSTQPFSSNNNNSYTSPPTTEVTSSNTSTIPPDSTPGQPGLSTSGAPTSHPRSPQSPSEGLSPRAPTLLPHEDLFCTRSIIQHHQHRGSFSSIFSDSSVTSPLATGDPTQPVTREDLRLLESRIMHAIDRKLSQLEERIMAKLYARNRL